MNIQKDLFLLDAYFRFFSQSLTKKNKDCKIADILFYPQNERLKKISDLIAKLQNSVTYSSDSKILERVWEKFKHRFEIEEKENQEIATLVIFRSEQVKKLIDKLRKEASLPTKEEIEIVPSQVDKRASSVLKVEGLQELLIRGFSDSEKDFCNKFSKTLMELKKVVEKILAGKFGNKIQSLLLDSDPLLDQQQNFFKLLLWNMCQEGEDFLLLENLQNACHNLSEDNKKVFEEQKSLLTNILKTLSIDKLLEVLFDESGKTEISEKNEGNSFFNKLVSQLTLRSPEWRECKQILSLPFRPNHFLLAQAVLRGLNQEKTCTEELLRLITDKELLTNVQLLASLIQEKNIDSFISRAQKVFEKMIHEKDWPLILVFEKILIEMQAYEKGFIFAKNYPYGKNGIQQQDLFQAFFSTATFQNLKLARSFVEQLPAPEREKFLRVIVLTLTEINVGEALSLIKEIQDPKVLSDCYVSIVCKVAKKNALEAVNTLEKLEITLKDEILAKASPLIVLSHPETVLHLLESIHNPQKSAEAHGNTFRALAKVDIEKALALVQKVSNRRKETCFTMILMSLVKTNPEKALEYTNRYIEDKATKGSLYVYIFPQLANKDYEKTLKICQTLLPGHQKVCYQALIEHTDDPEKQKQLQELIDAIRLT